MTVTQRIVSGTKEPQGQGAVEGPEPSPTRAQQVVERDRPLSPHQAQTRRVVDPGPPSVPLRPLAPPNSGRVVPANGQSAPYDSRELGAWYLGDAARGRDTTAGDATRGIPGRRNAMPVQRGSDWRVMINFGAGAKGKVPFDFTAEHMRRARAAADAAERAAGPSSNPAQTERVRLAAAVVEMENIVYAERLSRMSAADRSAYWAGSGAFATPSQGAATDLDCVDQASNVTSYLVVLAHAGELQHHRIIHPGLIHLGMQPHYFGRIEERGGTRFRFDMYHRGRFGVPPLVQPQ